MDIEWDLSRSYTSDGVGIRCAVVLLGSGPGGNGPLPHDHTGADSPSPSLASASYQILTGTQGGSLVQYDRWTGDLQVLPYRHQHAVTALLANDTMFVTGCKDAVIRLFDSQHHELLAELTGHAEGKAVTSLAWATDDDNNDGGAVVAAAAEQKKEKTWWLLSGSWDGTARVWNVATKSLVAVLPNHENSVCVTAIRTSVDLNTNNHGSNNTVLTIATGSAGLASNNVIAGHTVRVWSVHTGTGQVQLLHSVANDHEGPIRDILHYGVAGAGNYGGHDHHLLTCSNDGTVKVRDGPTGTCQSTMMFFTQQQHPPMLLSLAAVVPTTDHDVAAVAADTFVATAEDGNVVVWSTTGTPQIIRHGTCVWKAIGLPDGDIATCCDDGVLRIFTQATDRLAPAADRQAFVDDVQAAIQKTQGGPTADEIAQLPLWQDHMTLPGRSEGQVQVFQKNGIAVAAQWSAVSRTWIEVGEVTGRSDTAGTIDGVRYDYVFPIEIDRPGGGDGGSGGVATLQIGYNTGENPFVAAQRFIDAHMLPQYYLSQIAEYVQQRAGQQPTTLGEALPATNTASTPVYYDHLPIRTYKSFDLPAKAAVSTLDKMKSKLQEFAAWSDDSPELLHVTSLMATLAASSRYHSSKIADAELSVLAQQLQTCTPSKSFPVLDLARLVVLHPHAADRPSSYWVGVVQRAIALCTYNDPQSPLEGPAVTALPMLTLRLFANALKAGGGAQQAVLVYLEMVLDGALWHAQSSNNKNVRLSIATLLYNTACYCYQKKQQPEGTMDAVTATATGKLVEICHVILTDAKSYEAEAIVRTLLALGTICLASPDARAVATGTYWLTTKVELAASSHTDQAKAIAKEVYSILSSSS